MPEQASIILAFDFGMQKIGIALGNSLTCSAKALTIIKARDGIPDWQQIAELISHWQATQLLVGLPVHMDGSAAEITHCARKFANRLRERYRLPVEMVDERLSSDEARRRSQNKNQQVDAIAAELLIEQWFAKGTD